MTGVQVVAILVTTIAETDPLFAQPELKDSEPVVASFSGEIIAGLRIYALVCLLIAKSGHSGILLPASDQFP